MENFIPILLSAGGAAFLTAIITGLKSLSSSKLESEAALMKRLNDAIRDGSEREDALEIAKKKEEDRAEIFRLERDEALEKAARYRRRLIDNGISPEE